MKKGKVEYKATPMGTPEFYDPKGSREKEQILQEPEAAYVVKKVREGLLFAEFHALQEMLGITEEKLGALVGMSRATLHRRKKTGNLDRSESDRLVRYARIYQRALDFYGHPATTARWLSSPALAFNGETPLNYADTEIGAREVEALIARLDYGVFS